MIYILAIIALIFVFWALLMYVRKSQWDTIHRNLLDLEDHFEGKVIRRGFATRPFFHGRVEGHPFTLNISSERIDNERINYVDISWELPVKETFTIADFNWLKKRRDKTAEKLKLIKSEQGKEFALMHRNKNRLEQLVKSPVIQQFVSQFENLCYVFLGKTGLICEFSTENLANATEFKSLNSKLELLKMLGKEFGK